MDKTGYPHILVREQETQIEKIAFGLKAPEVTGLLSVDGKEIVYHADPSCTIKEIISSSDGKPENLSEITGVHVGLPLGMLIGVDGLDIALDAVGLLYSYDLRILSKRDCPLNYLQLVVRTLQEISCGRCVMCREGCKQIRALLLDMMEGRARMEDVALLEELCGGISDGSHCSFGRGVSKLVHSGIQIFRETFAEHVARKCCDSLVCNKYVTFHILGNCVGCGECMDVCKEDAVEGRKGMIHVIDNDMCIKCGECRTVCSVNAVVKAGKVKPLVPKKPVPCGTWKR